MLIKIQVEAYAGYKANERPRSIKIRERVLPIVEVLDRWYGTDHDYFKLKAEDGYIYIIRYDRGTDVWDFTMMERAGDYSEEQ
jgi:hypothetical protein